MSSSRKVGLKGFSNFLAGVPGTLMALFKGVFGVMGTAAASLSDDPLPMYPNPTSAGWACAASDLSLSSANGPLPSIGEWIVVASANRGVLGCLREAVDEDPAEEEREGPSFRAGGLLPSEAFIVLFCGGSVWMRRC